MGSGEIIMRIRSLRAAANRQLSGNYWSLFKVHLQKTGIFAAVVVILLFVLGIMSMCVGLSTWSALDKGELQEATERLYSGLLLLDAWISIGRLILCALCVILPFSVLAVHLDFVYGVIPDKQSIFAVSRLWLKALWLQIVTNFFVFLWSILLIVPGIIKAYSYSMAPYVLADNPYMSVREALRVSKEITKGHKLELFFLQLSTLSRFFAALVISIVCTAVVGAVLLLPVIALGWGFLIAVFSLIAVIVLPLLFVSLFDTCFVSYKHTITINFFNEIKYTKKLADEIAVR